MVSPPGADARRAPSVVASPRAGGPGRGGGGGAGGGVGPRRRRGDLRGGRPGLTPYLAEPTGTYTLQARAAGAAPDSPPALSVSVSVSAGAAQTAAFVDLGPGQSPQLQVLDDQTAAATEGTAQVRVVAAAVGHGSLEAQVVGGPRSPATCSTARPRRTSPSRPARRRAPSCAC